MRSEYNGGPRSLPIRRLLALALALLLTACGSSTRLHPSYAVLTMSATNSGFKFSSYVVSIDSVILTQANGQIAYLSSSPQVVDLARLSDLSELVSAYAVPFGTYVSATITLDFVPQANLATPMVSVNVNGKPVDAVYQTATGTTPTTTTVLVTFDPAKPLVLDLQHASPVHMDLDLQAFNSINTTPTVPVVMVLPYVVVTPSAVDATSLRARGSYVNVQSDGTFVMNLRPFYSLSAALGAVVVTPTADAYFNVNGVVYTGSAGLAAMAGLRESTVIAAYGTLTGLAGPDSITGTNPSFSAKEIYAGSSQENGLSYVSGMVSARSGLTLTLVGATLNYISGYTIPYPGAVVTISAEIPVTRDGANVSGLSAQSISVGQYVYISGTTNFDTTKGLPPVDASGRLVFDATPTGGGSARLLHTRLWGTLSSAAPTNATFDLLTLGLFAPTAYNFAGTGATAADPAAYLVNSGTTDLSGTAQNTLMAIDGAPTPFGSAPPDFTATAVTAASAITQTLVVDWPSGEVAPFISASSGGYVVDLSKATVGSLADIFEGPAGMSLKALPASPLITTTGADQTSLQLSIGSSTLTKGVSVFSTPSAYYTAVAATINGTNKFRRLLAAGQYNSVSNTFVARRISMALVE